MRNRIRITTVVSAGLLLLIAVGTSQAQRIEPVAVTSRGSPPDPAYQASRESINPLGGVIGGVVGAAVGLVAGGMAAAEMKSGQRCDDCGYGILAVVAGEAIGLAMGAHYGSGGNANPLLTSLVTTGIGVAGLFAAYEGGPILLMLTPVAQLAAVLLLER